MAELMHRVVLGLQSRQLQVLLHRDLHALDGQAGVAVGQEQGAVGTVGVPLALADEQIGTQSLAAGLVEVDDALLVSLTQHPHRAQGGVDVLEIDAHQLGHAHTAVEEQGDHAKIPLPMGRFGVVHHRREQVAGLVQGQKLRQGLLPLGGVDVGGGVVGEVAALVHEELEQGADGRQLAGLGGGLILSVGVGVQEEIVDLIRSHLPQKVQVHGFHRDGHELFGVVQDLRIPLAEEVAKEGTQVDEVLLRSALGAALDHGLIAGELPHNGGEFGYADLVAHGGFPSFPWVFSVHYYTKSHRPKSGQTVNFTGFSPFITVLSQLIAIW